MFCCWWVHYLIMQFAFTTQETNVMLGNALLPSAYRHFGLFRKGNFCCCIKSYNCVAFAICCGYPLSQTLSVETKSFALISGRKIPFQALTKPDTITLSCFADDDEFIKRTLHHQLPRLNVIFARYEEKWIQRLAVKCGFPVLVGTRHCPTKCEPRIKPQSRTCQREIIIIHSPYNPLLCNVSTQAPGFFPGHRPTIGCCRRSAVGWIAVFIIELIFRLNQPTVW